MKDKNGVIMPEPDPSSSYTDDFLKDLTKEAEKSQMAGKNFLLLFAGIYGMSTLYHLMQYGFIGLLDLGFGIMFAACYFWSRKEPRKALLAGVVVYLATHFLVALIHPRPLEVFFPSMFGAYLKLIILYIMIDAWRMSPRKIPD